MPTLQERLAGFTEALEMANSMAVEQQRKVARIEGAIMLLNTLIEEEVTDGSDTGDGNSDT